MKRRLIAAAGTLLMLAAIPVHANADTTPNGPWVTPEQEISMARMHSNEQLVEALHRLERRGAVELEVIGQSNEGRDLYLASVGHGPREVFYMTQQHGNEVHATEAALQVLRTLSGNGAEARKIRDEITLRIAVRVNPDGTERFWRQNYDPDNSGPFHAAGRGFDINRYHDPNMAPEDNPVPEAAAVRRAYDKYQPEIVVDYHNQGTYVTDDGDMVTMSVFWPNNPGVDAAVVDRSKQVAVQIFDAVSPKGHATVTRYPGGTDGVIARNAYGLMGSASVLVETRGQVTAIGQKSGGMLIRQVYDAMYDLAVAAADGSLEAIDPNRADSDIITDRGSAPNPRFSE
jgi:murein tripeptide amidase MpaA